MTGLARHAAALLGGTLRRLAPGYAERLAIYRPWPVLVHLRLFGAAYRGLVNAQLRLAGAT